MKHKLKTVKPGDTLNVKNVRVRDGRKHWHFTEATILFLGEEMVEIVGSRRFVNCLSYYIFSGNYPKDWPMQEREEKLPWYSWDRIFKGKKTKTVRERKDLKIWTEQCRVIIHLSKVRW